MSGDSYPKFKAAAVQAEPIPLDRDACVDKACSLIEEAGRNGAKIIAFPEGFIPGHPNWLYFYPPGEAMKSFYREFFKNSVEVPGPATERLGRAARKAGAYVAIGINERTPGSMGSLYNSILFLDPEGQVIGVHRKLVPTTTERLVLSSSDGSTIRTYKTPYGDLGGLLCGENTNSLARFALLAQGEKIHTAHWPSFPTDYNKNGAAGVDVRIRFHAYEGKVFVISAAAVFGEESIKRLCHTDAARQMVIRGNSVSGIVNPYGQYIGGPLTGDEGIVYADIDIETMIDAKTLHDVTGHYGRFDVLSLHYNRSNPKPITFGGPAEMPASQDDVAARIRSSIAALEADQSPASVEQAVRLRLALERAS